jgi:hypothetical protein
MTKPGRKPKIPKLDSPSLMSPNSEDETVNGGSSSSTAPTYTGRALEKPFIGLPTSVISFPREESPPWLDVIPTAFTTVPNFISNIIPDRSRLIWRPTSKGKSFYILYYKYDNDKLRSQKVFIPGRLGEYIDLDQPSSFKRWQVKLSVDDDIAEHIADLLRLGPFNSTKTKDLTISMKTSDPGLAEFSDIDPNGPFPFLYDGTRGAEDYSNTELHADSFVHGTEVIVECIFTAYNMKGRSGYSWKLLSVIKACIGGVSESLDSDDNLVVDEPPLISYKGKRKSTL